MEQQKIYLPLCFEKYESKSIKPKCVSPCTTSSQPYLLQLGNSYYKLYMKRWNQGEQLMQARIVYDPILGIKENTNERFSAAHSQRRISATFLHRRMSLKAL